METLHEGKDFEIIQKKVVTEYFVWKCPNCGEHNEDIEWYVKNRELFCARCSTTYKYQFNNSPPSAQ